MNLTDRLVVVTGGGSGIGAALATQAVTRGARTIAVLDIDEAAAQSTVERVRGLGAAAETFVCDIADIDALQQVATQVCARYGSPGLVCANAGVNPTPSTILDGSLADLNWALSVNVVGTVATLQAFGRRMVAATEPGWLLVTASEHAIGVPFPGNGFYTASKHALLGVSDVLRRELPPHVGISVMIPGLVATGLWRSPATRGGEPDPAAQEFTRSLMARGAQPTAVAALALEAIAAQRFLIATHPHAKRYADSRAADLADGFAALRASGAPEHSYDVTELVTAMTSADHSR